MHNLIPSWLATRLFHKTFNKIMRGISLFPHETLEARAISFSARTRGDAAESPDGYDVRSWWWKQGRYEKSDTDTVDDGVDLCRPSKTLQALRRRSRGMQLYIEASDPKPSLDTRTLK